MLRHSRFLIGCCGAALAMASFLVGLEVSATTAASSMERIVPVVNRALKSDRLPPASKSRNAVNGPAQRQAPTVPVKPKLLEGCEPVVSSIGQSPLAQIPGRCLS
jgi:hypothetical protein